MIAVERVYRTHMARLRRAVQGAVRDVDDAVIEDACQDAWLAALRNRARIRAVDDRQLYAYLVTTATRRGWKLAAHERTTSELVAELADRLDVQERVISREQLRLAGASERQRRVLWLHTLGLSYAEIATVTGTTPRTVERQLQRGRRALQA